MCPSWIYRSTEFWAHRPQNQHLVILATRPFEVPWLSLSGLISSPSGKHGTIWQLSHDTPGSIVNDEGSLRLSPNDTMQPSSSKCLMPQFLWQLLGGCCYQIPRVREGSFLYITLELLRRGRVWEYLIRNHHKSLVLTSIPLDFHLLCIG